MIGEIDKKALTEKSTITWFKPVYDYYTVDQTCSIPNNSIHIVVYFGDWCSDSHTQLPRFIKIAEYYQLSYELYALDREKKSPMGKESKQNIVKVPTFIVLKNGLEIGRIIETPIISIEKDLMQIINTP